MDSIDGRRYESNASFSPAFNFAANMYINANDHYGMVRIPTLNEINLYEHKGNEQWSILSPLVVQWQQ